MEMRNVHCPNCKERILRVQGEQFRIFSKGITVTAKDVVAKCRCGNIVSLKKSFVGKHLVRKGVPGSPL